MVIQRSDHGTQSRRLPPTGPTASLVNSESGNETIVAPTIARVGEATTVFRHTGLTCIRIYTLLDNETQKQKTQRPPDVQQYDGAA